MSEAGDLGLQRGHFLQCQFHGRRGRYAAGRRRSRIRRACGGRDAQALVVEERALAALGDVQLVIGGIVDHARNDRALALRTDRDRKLPDAVQEVGGAVQQALGASVMGGMIAVVILARLMVLVVLVFFVSLTASWHRDPSMRHRRHSRDIAARFECARMNRARIVAIEFGICRSGRIGGASGSVTVGNGRFLEHRGGTRS